jgi:hypothetical protein
MAATKIATSVAQAACDAIVDSADAGAGAGYVEIRTGAPPATVATAASGTLLGTLTLGDPAFGAATNASPAVATANAITGDASADATGTAGWFRVFDSTGAAKWQGDISTVAAATGDMRLDSTSIVAGGTISISSWTASMPTA